MKLYRDEDATFVAEPGSGLWTKADSVTQSDDFEVLTIQYQRSPGSIRRIAPWFSAVRT